jgi:hypothetical protein
VTGTQEYEARVLFSQLATTLNIRASDPAWTREPSLERTIAAANRISALLERDDLFEPSFRTLMRHSVSLMVNALPHEEAAVEAARSARTAEREYQRLKKKLTSSRGKADKDRLSAAEALATTSRAAARAAVLQQKTTGTSPAWKKWLAEAETSRDPRTAYNRACYYAERGDVQKAMAALKVAVRSPEFKKLAASDPVLTQLPASSGFRTLTAREPRADFWVMPPFAEVKAELDKVGIRDVRDLAGMSSAGDVLELSGFLKRRPIEIRRLITLATWVTAIDSATRRQRNPGISKLLVELVLALYEEGVESVAALERRWPPGPLTPEDGFGKVITELAQRFDVTVTMPAARTWLDAVRKL